jgi:hypothetical protein
VAVNSYLPEAEGALVAAGAFHDEDSAIAGVKALRDLGLRRQDITVLANDGAAARRVAAAGDAYAPRRSPLPLPFFGALPKEVRRRYGKALRAGHIVVVAASDGQPADTLATVLERVSKASDVGVWWQGHTSIFPPATEGGPL